MKPTRQQEAEARKLLKASGFSDLEGPDRDGPLSDRGNLHPVAETEDEHVRLRGRIADGASYTEWAQAVLHARRFRTALERKVWASHVAGDGLRTTAADLEISYHQARDIVTAIKASRVTQVTDIRKVTKWPRWKRERTAMFRRLSESTAMQLAAVLIRGLRRKDSLQQRSPR